MRYGIIVLVLFCWASLTYAQKNEDPDALVGKWLSSQKKNQVQIYRQGSSYFGKLIWMAEPIDPTNRQPKVDAKNPVENLRKRRLLDIPIMINFVYKGNNVWSEGQIYNPEDGKTYGGELTLTSPNTLDVHGFIIGIPFLGKTKTWTRVK